MTKEEQICAYFEAMAAKVGGDVRVIRNSTGAYVMLKNGDDFHSVKVRTDEPIDTFNRKVRRLMEL